MKFGIRVILYAIAFSFQIATVIAQSDNYQSWNFNTPSTLLAGSVTGGGAGPSAIYYNPALIDQENIPNFSLSTNLISVQFFKAKNIAGEGNDAEQFVFKIQPRIISYTLDSKNEKLGVEFVQHSCHFYRQLEIKISIQNTDFVRVLLPSIYNFFKYLRIISR